MDERGRLGVKRCAEQRSGYQTDVFTRTEPEWVEVDGKRVRVERSRNSVVLGWEESCCGGWNWMVSWKRD